MTDPRPRPRLVAVEPVSDSPEPAADSRKNVPMAFWILAVLVFVCAIAAAYQTQQVAELNEEVTALTGELATAHGQIDAYEGRLVEIRGAVSDLQSQLGALDELVQRDPIGE